MASIPTSCFVAPKSCHDSMIKSGRLSPRAPSSPVSTPPSSPMTERARSVSNPFAKFGQILQNQIKTSSIQPTGAIKATAVDQLPPTTIPPTTLPPPTISLPTKSILEQGTVHQPNRRKSDLSPEAVGMSA